MEIDENYTADIQNLIKGQDSPVEPTFELAKEIVHLHNTNAIKKYYLGEKPLKKGSIKDIYMHASRTGMAHVWCFGLEAKTSALKKVMIELAKQIVCDGEGISKLIEVNVSNAKNKIQAKKIAFSIAESLLVKTAICGQDPNWGRIIMAIGKTLEKIEQDQISLKFGKHLIIKNGMVEKKLNEKKLKNYMKNKILKINLDLKLGPYNKTVWSSDLTKKYIEINAGYRS